mmetsp:Transcript_2437/g.3490  ORF Transcript_2437/g.3490 Transcript_2437/m.3490 type:complete len:94 (-) Transcript_2437:74-355(-)
MGGQMCDAWICSQSIRAEILLTTLGCALLGETSFDDALLLSCLLLNSTDICTAGHLSETSGTSVEVICFVESEVASRLSGTAVCLYWQTDVSS